MFFNKSNRKNEYNKRLNIFKILSHILILFFAFLLQTTIIPSIPFLNSSPNLLLIIVFTYGLIYGEEVGIITGFVCGLLFDLYFDESFGVYILIYSLLGYLNGILYNFYYGDDITFPMILCIINCFIFNIYIFVIHFLVRGRLVFIFTLFNVIIPNVLFTLIITIMLYKILYDYNMINRLQ